MQRNVYARSSGAFRLGLAVFAAASWASAEDAPYAAGSDGQFNDETYETRVINPDLTGGRFFHEANAYLVWGTDGSILRSADGSDWQHAKTPIAADIADLDGNERSFVAVGEQATIIHSADAGRTWRRAIIDGRASDLRAVIHHRSSGSWIAVGSEGTILRSSDGGKQWRQIKSGVRLTFEALFVEPRRGAILIGGEHGTVGVSTDAGKSWSLTTIEMPDPVTPIIGFHAYGDLLLARSARGRFLQSKDRGASWDLVTTDSQAYFTDSAYDSHHGSIVLTTHMGSVFVSRDHGTSWKSVPVASDGRQSYLSSVHYDEMSRTLLVAGHGGMLARSTDGGKHWARIESDIRTNLEAVIEAPHGRYVVAGEGGFLAISANSGRRWLQVSPELNIYLREVVAVPNSDVVIATSDLGDVLRSVNGGRDWQRIEVRYPNMNTPPNLRALVIEPLGRSLVAAGPPGTIIHSMDRGASWRIRHWTPLEAEEAFPWIVVDATRKALVVAEARGSLYRSNDGGHSWQRSGVHTDRELWHGAVLESTGTLVLAGQGGVAARSSDTGATWSFVDTGSSVDLYGSYADEASGAFFLMGKQGTLLRSTDDARTWQSMPSVTDASLRRMIRDPKHGTLVSFGAAGVVLLSDDRGASWQSVASGTEAELRKASIEPITGALILVGQHGAVLRSSDGGRTWQTLSSHTNRHFRSATFTPAGELILVGERIVQMRRARTPSKSRPE